MCPFCMATAALIAGSATGTGSLTAIVAGAILMSRKRKTFPEQSEAEEVNCGNHCDGSEESDNGLAR
jgi:hypothetical protein